MSKWTAKKAVFLYVRNDVKLGRSCRPKMQHTSGNNHSKKFSERG